VLEKSSVQGSSPLGLSSLGILQGLLFTKALIAMGVAADSEMIAALLPTFGSSFAVFLGADLGDLVGLVRSKK
jgi:hypothetical protein